MKGKILIASIIALAITFFSLPGLKVRTAYAEAYPINSFICKTVTYGPFGNCINGIESRDVIDKTPLGCGLTLSEQQGRNQVCGQVLGVKVYGPGTLLRTPEGKIYVVVSGQTVKFIPDLNELKSYSGHVTYNVSNATMTKYLQNFSQVLGVKIYADGTLLRTPDHKIYVVENGKKQYIRSLEELQQYSNHRIINISYSVLADF
jgi:membrane-associated protease RseP (regulator of RpoE activity)